MRRSRLLGAGSEASPFVADFSGGAAKRSTFAELTATKRGQCPEGCLSLRRRAAHARQMARRRRRCSRRRQRKLVLVRATLWSNARTLLSRPRGELLPSGLRDANRAGEGGAEPRIFGRRGAGVDELRDRCSPQAVDPKLLFLRRGSLLTVVNAPTFVASENRGDTPL